jgi:uncharacterized membrane protein
MTICVVPFSASFVAAYPNSRVSLAFYAVNLLCANFGQLLIAECAHYFKLNGKHYSLAFRRAIIQRIFVAPPFYILSFFLAPYSTSLAFIVLVIPPVLYLIPGFVDKLDSAP